jgi:MFS family permease
MVMVRMFQGAFNGAVGVARSAVKDITDSTNEGRAYSIIGLAWSLGGILGPAIGGWCVDTLSSLSVCHH